MSGVWRTVTNKLARLVTNEGRGSTLELPRRPKTPTQQRPATPGARRPGPRAARTLEYAPQPDGRADPGEIVWTWVAYEDQPAQGKDRPVLVVGRAGSAVYGLMLSSQSDRDGQRHWFPLGTGTWDRQNRLSWVRLDRVLELAEDGIRREGAVLDRTRFERVAEILRARYGWR